MRKKKLLSLALGLGLSVTTVGSAFAQQAGQDGQPGQPGRGDQPGVMSMGRAEAQFTLRQFCAHTEESWSREGYSSAEHMRQALGNAQTGWLAETERLAGGMQCGPGGLIVAQGVGQGTATGADPSLERMVGTDPQPALGTAMNEGNANRPEGNLNTDRPGEGLGDQDQQVTNNSAGIPNLSDDQVDDINGGDNGGGDGDDDGNAAGGGAASGESGGGNNGGNNGGGNNGGTNGSGDSTAGGDDDDDDDSDDGDSDN
jgi:hypothetical protein